MTSIQAGFDFYKDIPGYKAIFKAVLKNVIQILVEQLSEQTDEESVLLTASVTDGTLSQLGSESGRYFLEGHDEIKSQFLGFCLKRHHKRKPQETLQVPQPKRFASAAHSIPDLTSLGSENDVYSTNLIPNLSDFSSLMTSHSNQLSGHTSGLTGLISLTGHNAKLSSQTPGLTGHVSRTEKPKIHPISLTKVKRKQQSPLHRSRLAVESEPIGSDKETVDKKVEKIGGTGVDMTICDRLQKHGTPADSDDVNTENVSNSAGQIDSVLAGESHIRIKTETPDYDEISNPGPNEVNTGKGVERSEKALDETIEENYAQNKETSIKIEALEEESDLEITGVEGEMNDTTGSFGVVCPDYNDGQLYAQDLSGMEGQGQRSNLEGHQFNYVPIAVGYGSERLGFKGIDPVRDNRHHGLTNIEPITDNGCGLIENVPIGTSISGVTASDFVITKRRHRYTKEALEMAIQAVKSRTMNRFKASQTFGIPKTTLFRIVDADGNIK